MADTRRISLSVPTDLASDLDYISSRLGVSRSGFVTQLLLSAELGKLRSLIESIPEQPSEADARRFRGDSKRYIAESIARLQELQGTLFDDAEG